MVLAAVVVGGTALGGAAISGRAAKKGAKAQEQAAGQASAQTAAAEAAALAEQRRQYDLTREDFRPFRESGTAALGRLDAASAGDMSSFMASPDYNFQRTEGQRDIGSSFAARGGAASGNALKALAEFNSNLARGQFGDWWNRQQNLVAAGQGALGTVASAGSNAANNSSNIIMNAGSNIAGNTMAAGNARASGIQQRGQGYGDAIASMGNLYGTYRLGKTMGIW